MKILNTKYPITQYFGESPALYAKYGYKGHTGLDLGAKFDNVYCEYYSIVVFCGTKGDYGNVIITRLDNGVLIRYAHLSKILVGVGQMVRRGDVIAISGNSGYSTGPHLHLQVDAAPITNGYGGAVDPLEFFNKLSGDIMDADFVTLLYRGLLGREPDAGGLAYFQKLNATAAYKEIYNSQEAIAYRSLISQTSINANTLSNQVAELNKTIDQLRNASAQEKANLIEHINIQTEQIQKLNDDLKVANQEIDNCRLNPPAVSDGQLSEMINKIIDAIKSIFKKGK